MGIEILRLFGGALLFSGVGWLIDWWLVGSFDAWAITGGITGACLELFAELYYFHRDR